ncbi:MAG: hypothetical protein U0361_10690 [Nitrospiraceae bacterium]
MDLARSVGNGSLSGDQRAMVRLFAGRLEDQGRFDEAIAMFQHVAKLGDSASQRAEGLWRVRLGPVSRLARYQSPAGTFRLVAESRANGLDSRGMYWQVRAVSADARQGGTGQPSLRPGV